MYNTAKKALLNSEIYYFTGKLCKNNHIDKRIALSRICYTCSLLIKKAQDLKHKERNVKYREQTRESKREYCKNWYSKNKDRIRLRQPIQDKTYYSKFKGRLKAKSMKYHSNKLKAIPKWANLESIKTFYANCPDGCQVDHIIPLQGKKVCGLHVENNLQYLTKSENCSKGNRY